MVNGKLRLSASDRLASGSGTSPPTCPAACRWDRPRISTPRFKAAWEALKARTTPERLAAAFKAMNIRGDD